ncbi:MAG: sensor histidine kinase [Chloroflexi bacterium]|nr:sensor histidine kinase [Chloroflexota bacterium]
MTRPNRTELDLETHGRLSILVVVAVGYLVTFLGAFSANGYTGTWLETFLALLFGVVFSLLCAYDWLFFHYVQGAWKKPLYFGIQLGLLFAIQWLIGPGGIWLVSLPLAGLAVEHLSPLWRWPVYLGILFGMFVSIGFRYQDWQSVFLFTLSVSPAIFFVVVFSEQGVRERTARQKAEELTADLEEANHRLSAYAAQVEELATTQERNRLAREIHDNLGHYLTVVNVQIGAAKVLLAHEPERAMAALDKAQGLTQEGLTAVRQSVSSLRESPLAKRPLPQAIAALVQESNNAGIVTDLTLHGDYRPLTPQTELTLYRVAQEGLTNIRKHARASRANLTLDYANPEQVQLMVADNGLGAAAAGSGFGLLGIRERVLLLNGDMEIETAVNHGFCLRVTIPK